MPEETRRNGDGADDGVEAGDAPAASWQSRESARGPGGAAKTLGLSRKMKECFGDSIALREKKSHLKEKKTAGIG